MAEINLTKNDSGSSKINLIKNDSSLKVNLVKGANQDAINSLYTQTKELRDETNELKDIASTKATEASNSAAIALEAIQDLTDLTVAAVEGATANASYNDATNTLTLTLVKGDKGDTGEQGIQGIKGDTGEQGIQGIQGIKGDKGDTGEQGIQGPIGPTGPQGIQGVQGIKGDTGDAGPQGPQGVQGVKGDTGLTGPQGIQGIQGKGIDTVTSNKVGLTTTVTLTGDFDNSPCSFDIQDGTSATGDMLKSTYDTNNNGIVDNAQMLTLDTSNTVAPTTMGQVKWNIDENTADLNLGNVTLQLGQEQLVIVRNDHTSTILNGRVVMATGTLGNSGRILVKPHTGTQALAKTVIGVATEDITVGSDGFVTTFGKVRNIDTTGSAYGETWVDGDILYIKPNDSGALTKVTPLDNELYMPIAFVIHAHTNGTLYIRTTGIDENRNKLISGTSIKTVNNTSILGSGNIDTTQATITGNAGTATKLQTARTISTTGDVTYTSALFDGSADVSGTATLSNTGVSAGTYKSVTVDSKGRITNGTNPTTLSGYGITDAQPLLVSGANIKTINGSSILENGDVSLVNLSGVTAYHLLQGNLAVSASTITQGFNTTLYTSSSATTGIDMSTQWGNTAEEKFGGLVWLKDRVEATNNFLYDTVRGATKEINSNTTEAEATLASGLTAFNSTGFTVGANTGHNSTTNNMVSWNFQTTHRITGTTNHGKSYECHYNPFTGFTMVKYTGSGLAGHEIPHMLGRKLSLSHAKRLSTANNWISSLHNGYGLNLNTTNAQDNTVIYSTSNDTNIILSTYAGENATGELIVLYGWTNSYFDEDNTLIGNYEVGVYQGTGATGNKVTTRGEPAWIMIKRLDSVEDWRIWDNQRDTDSTIDHFLYPNLSSAEVSGNAGYYLIFNSDGFTLNNTAAGQNASGGQYLYMVAYDTNSNGGGSYYPLASDTANVQVNNALIPIAQGIDSNGTKNTILSKNETFSGVTYTQGKNYPYYDALGNRGVSNKAPNYGLTNPSNGGDFYNVLSNKWFTSAGTEITNGRNYLNHIVYADNDGGVLYVEELPKIEYKDTVQVDSLKILSGFDLGQTWKNVTASRSTGVTYTNTTGKPIMVAITTTYSTAVAALDLVVDGITIGRHGHNTSTESATRGVIGIVPNGSTYNSPPGGGTIFTWAELR